MERNRRQFICDLFAIALGSTVARNTLAAPCVAVVEGKPLENVEGEVLTCFSDKLPDFSVYTLNGTARKLSSYYGKPLVANIWADYCMPCKEEIPLLNTLAESISVLGICDDPMINNSTNLSHALGRLEQRVNYPNVYVTKETDRKLNACYVSKYGVGLAVPTTFVLGADGRISYHRRGTLTEGDEYRKLVAAISVRR
ncbi:MAG: TlpA disulfide reductase family protein [Nanoarchaeota archaeon]